MSLPDLPDLIDQLYKGAIDPGSSLFLPTVILEQPLPAEPLAIGDYDWGELSSVFGTLPSDLCAKIKSGTICTPGTPATLVLTQMRIKGLSRALPSQHPTVNGTRVVATFAFGDVPHLPPGVTVPKCLGVEGTFAITLSCCASTDGNTCSGTPAPQTVTGTFAMTFDAAVLTMTLNVSDKLDVTVEALSLTGDVSFDFQTASPEQAAPRIDLLLKGAFAKNAAPLVRKIVNDRLGSAATRTALADVLTPVFKSQAKQSLLSWFVSELYLAAVDPSSKFYLPVNIKQATAPVVLEPFSAGGFNVPDVNQWLPTGGATICAGIGSSIGKVEIQSPGSLVPLWLSGIQISGTSNLLPAPMLTIGGDRVYGMTVCNSVTGYPKLTISGDFKLTVTCCTTTDRKTCSGTPESNDGTGTFTATIEAAAVAVDVTVTGTGSNLVATADAIYFHCDDNIDNPSNIHIDINITSIPHGSGRDDWNNLAKGVFNAQQAISTIVDQIRVRLNSDAVREKLSAVATNAINSIIAEDADLARQLVSELTASRSRRGKPI